jgi:phosphatidylglycerol---prolipoprotein diacylglyceryl transferase
MINLLSITWDVDPAIFPGLEIPRWYGLMWVLGLLLGHQVMQYIYKREGRTPEALNDLTVYVLAGTFLGARLGHILFYDPLYYWHHPIEILPIKLEPEFQFVGFAGLASHGAAVVIPIAMYLYCRKHREHYLWLADRLALGTALAGSFIRFGNLLNSEIIGTPTNVPWAFVFTRIDHVPRHPAQLYEAVSCMILFMVLFYMWYTKSNGALHGRIFGIFLVALFSLRFAGEFFKVNQEPFEDHLLLNMGQLLSIPFLLAGIFLLFRSGIKKDSVCKATP